jgi:hypothetical protein
MSLRSACASVVIVCAVLYVPPASGQTQPKTSGQDQAASVAFPSKDQINLVVSQADRAFDSYASAVQQESELSGDTQQIQQMVSKDAQVLELGRKVIGALKENPELFNGPMGFLLVGGLDDASRNMAICQGQAGMQAITALQTGDAVTSALRLQLGQNCIDTSTLLYTISETAFSMYTNYLTAYTELTGSLFEELNKCTGILKSQKK